MKPVFSGKKGVFSGRQIHNLRSQLKLNEQVTSISPANE